MISQVQSSLALAGIGEALVVDQRLANRTTNWHFSSNNPQLSLPQEAGQTISETGEALLPQIYPSPLWRVPAATSAEELRSYTDFYTQVWYYLNLPAAVTGAFYSFNREGKRPKNQREHRHAVHPADWTGVKTSQMKSQHPASQHRSMLGIYKLQDLPALAHLLRRQSATSQRIMYPAARFLIFWRTS
ncbi:hypothetical protein FPOA_03310 [Fusarium poae]|uniref:Uncharacterized protein n=1 Tax=Fusarium poae TaxID=36050 RepID=A0A1B8B9H2_FUSPO|nr:hypothetical protein FPOA_03310 [Fusarium poae]